MPILHIVKDEHKDDPPDVDALPRRGLDGFVKELAASLEPRTAADGQTEASVHRAKLAQKAERRCALVENARQFAEDQRQRELIDSVRAQKVAAVLPADLMPQDRHQAAAVAVRLHDPTWQHIARHRHAQANLMALRTFLLKYRIVDFVPENELRVFAEQLANLSWWERLHALDGSLPVGPKEYGSARLGFLSLTEEQP